MRILLTNDDGIHAPGLMALYNELKGDFDVSVVAPESEMSAVGHAITLRSPLRVQEIFKNESFFGYAVTGTPADCVKIAVQELLESPPDIILSGINLGANVGVNVLYSGTVSAATEGAFLGVRSAAISLDTHKDPDFSIAASFSRRVIRFITESGFNNGVALNVNVPALPRAEIKGVAITKQGMGRFRERYERRVDPRGNIYYWLTGETGADGEREDSDARALAEGMIAITPISFDLTCTKEIEKLKGLSFPDLNP
ncbi:MAG: 5'/3'-nucleotidase SurE [Deltaproteobacteria bacterium]|nr:5'/3'-nucleotidase SurE [Deltaproteobacteria bacterium]